MKAQIIEIGPKAIGDNEAILIFFNETATELLKEYTIIQRFVDDNWEELVIGDKISFGEQVYTITHLGKNVLDQLRDLGHVSFFFGEAPKEELINAITLKEEKLPEISQGMNITYKAG